MSSFCVYQEESTAPSGGPPARGSALLDVISARHGVSTVGALVVVGAQVLIEVSALRTLTP